jgi:hypothetical protein
LPCRGWERGRAANCGGHAAQLFAPLMGITRAWDRSGARVRWPSTDATDARREHPTAPQATGAGKTTLGSTYIVVSMYTRESVPSHIHMETNGGQQVDRLCMHASIRPHGFLPHKCMAARQLGCQIFALDRTSLTRAVSLEQPGLKCGSVRLLFTSSSHLIHCVHTTHLTNLTTSTRASLPPRAPAPPSPLARMRIATRGPQKAQCVKRQSLSRSRQMAHSLPQSEPL